MLTAYKFRLKPNSSQKVLLSKHFGCCRFVYNYMLGTHNHEYEQDNTVKWNRFKYQNAIPSLKKDEDYAFLKEVNSQSLQCAILNLDKAFKNFFEKRGAYPNFKSRRNKQSFHVPQSVKLVDNRLYIPKFKDGISVVVHRELQGAIKSATISKTCNDEYYASILVENGIVAPDITLDVNKAIGIDLGIKEFAILSDGTKIDNPRHYVKSQKRLKRLQRKHSRKVKCSSNRNKSRVKLAKHHTHVSNQRKDFHHKLSRKIVDDSQIDIICVEDLHVKGMVKNHCLAKAISDVGWSQFKTFLLYKAKNAGKLVIEIGRFEASSKTCSRCGHVKHDLTLSDREWCCPICNTNHDRDVNAAINIRNIGIRTLGTSGSYACGDNVRRLVGTLLSSKQEAPSFR